MGYALGDDLLRIQDEDALNEDAGPAPIVRDVYFGETLLGRVALAPQAAATEEEDRKLVEIFSREIGGAIRTATLFEESRHMATVDALTGIYNRGAFLKTAQNEVYRAARYGSTVSIVLLDIDNFKTVNDTYGHAAGDEVLKAMGGVLKFGLRDSDVSAGGAGRIRDHAVRDPRRWRSDPGRTYSRTHRADGCQSWRGRHPPRDGVLGVSTFKAGDTLETFVDRADMAMYAAKHGAETRSVPTALNGRAGEGCC